MNTPKRDTRGNGHVDWWAHAVKQRREIRELRARIAFISAALPVLKTMCEAAGLPLGAAKAQEMIDELAKDT